MILLDTHAFFWALMTPHKLSARARYEIGAASTQAVSSASIYEILFKHSIGKWPEVRAIAKDGLTDNLARRGFVVRPADGHVMERAGGLNWTHRDPFDRMIVATSLIEACPLISRNDALLNLDEPGLEVIW